MDLWIQHKEDLKLNKQNSFQQIHTITIDYSTKIYPQTEIKQYLSWSVEFDDHEIVFANSFIEVGVI